MTGSELIDSCKTCVDNTRGQTYMSTASASAAERTKQTGFAPRFYGIVPPTSDGMLLHIRRLRLLLTQKTGRENVMVVEPTAVALVESYPLENEHVVPASSDQAIHSHVSNTFVAITQIISDDLYLHHATDGITTTAVVTILLEVGKSYHPTARTTRHDTKATDKDVNTSTNVLSSDSKSLSSSYESTTASTPRSSTTNESLADTTTSPLPPSSGVSMSQSTPSTVLITAGYSPCFSAPCSTATSVPSPPSDAKTDQSSGVPTPYQAYNGTTSSRKPISQERPSTPTTPFNGSQSTSRSSATPSRLSKTSTLGLPNSSDTSDPSHSSRSTGHHIVTAVVGGVIGGIILLSAVATLVLCIRRRMRSARRGEFV